MRTIFLALVLAVPALAAEGVKDDPTYGVTVELTDV